MGKIVDIPKSGNYNIKKGEKMQQKILKILEENQITKEEFAFVCGVPPEAIENFFCDPDKVTLMEYDNIQETVKCYFSKDLYPLSKYYTLEGGLFLVKSKLKSADIIKEMKENHLSVWQIKQKYNMPISAIDLLVQHRIDYTTRREAHNWFANNQVFFFD